MATRVHITDETQLPEEVFGVDLFKTVRKPDARAIGKLLRMGAQIPGAVLLKDGEETPVATTTEDGEEPPVATTTEDTDAQEIMHDTAGKAEITKPALGIAEKSDAGDKKGGIPEKSDAGAKKAPGKATAKGAK